MDERPEERMMNFTFHSLLDNMHAIIYVTDIETNEILFMSRTMQEEFGVADPQGKLCWEVMVRGTDGPCPFCPVKRLREQMGNGENISQSVSEEKNNLTGRVYSNYDSIITWIDGRRVHLRHSVDVTDYKRLRVQANVDELTGMYNRRAGKERLARKLRSMEEQGQFGTICMYDLNELKKINDSYGHVQGDHALSLIGRATLANIEVNDLAFRLSGDEFVIVYDGMHLQEAREKMEALLKQISEAAALENIQYELSFCYGLVEFSGRDGYSMSELISMADEQMYCQKREYHIQKAQERLNASPSQLKKEIEEFSYDKEHLYDALIQATENYVYAGNMKTGTFRYPPAMIAEFDLPGEIIPNAAAVWGRLVHPEDKQIFLEANQVVSDGRAEGHDVRYRAVNRKGEWVPLRCTGHLVRDEYGKPDLFAGIIYHV